MPEKFIGMVKNLIRKIPQETLKEIADRTTPEEFKEEVMALAIRKQAETLVYAQNWINLFEEDPDEASENFIEIARCLGMGPEDIYRQMNEEQ